jgi:hypothetical protein
MCFEFEQGIEKISSEQTVLQGKCSANQVSLRQDREKLKTFQNRSK